jgi:hypothetical protein
MLEHGIAIAAGKVLGQADAVAVAQQADQGGAARLSRAASRWRQISNVAVLSWATAAKTGLRIDPVWHL